MTGVGFLLIFVLIVLIPLLRPKTLAVMRDGISGLVGYVLGITILVFVIGGVLGFLVWGWRQI